MSQRKVREGGMHRNRHKEITSPKPLVGKTKDADFHEFLQIARLKRLRGSQALLG